MCLILVAHRAHPVYRLVVAANRDEWFRRPTAAAAFWSDAPQVFAGRDLEQNGTWLGVTTNGRFAAITNFRDPGSQRPGAPSRGRLVADFLRGATEPADYLEQLRPEASAYNGFSLLVGEGAALYYLSNREGEIRELGPGVYGLSNHLLDVPWPKVQRGKAGLAAQLESRVVSGEALLKLLDDTRAAPDHELPQTGVGAEWERRLSSLRIVGEGYGTRSSTVLLVGGDQVDFVERSFGESGAETGIVTERFALRA